MTPLPARGLLVVLSCSLVSLGLSGCGLGPSTAANPTGGGLLQSHAVQGQVHGGQQPVIGAKVYLYAAGNGGYGSASRSLLAAPGYVTTDATGSFSITGKYACGTTDQVYVLATGGNNGGGTNPNIVLMTGLGLCTTLLANANTTFVSINEVTTVASVYALAPYLSGATSLGTTAADQTGLTQAFAAVNSMVDTASGTAPATVANGRGTVPQAAINSLADSIAACVNSISPFSSCSSLYADTAYAGNTPVDTLAATLSIAQHPIQNASAIFNLATPSAPFQPTLSSAPGTWSFATTYAGDVLTYHNDSSRSSVQPTETVLTPANVNSTTFGKKFTFPVDGYLWGQPLYVSNYTMADGTAHNVVFVASAHASVYAFDADGNNPAQGFLWKASLPLSGEIAIPNSQYNCSDAPVESGITGTPVIDRTTGTLYVVAVTSKTVSGTTTNYQRLHALNLADGNEKFNAPSVITASITGSGNGSSGGILTFDPLKEHQHAALLLANGTVTIAFASHCDFDNYHGWVLGYNSTNVTQQTSVFNDTPNGTRGGIWMGIGGPSADASGNLYVVTGNGTFDANTGGSNIAEGAVRIPPPTAGSTNVTFSDYFVPSNQLTLTQQDNDVGTTNALLFNDPASSFAPNLAVITDKTGRIYLLNQKNLGTYDTGSNGPDGKNGDLQDWVPGANIFDNFAYFNGTLYVGTSANPLQAFSFLPGNASRGGQFNTTPASQSTFSFSPGRGEGASSPAVSANGTSNAITWAVDRQGSNSILYAFPANNLGTLLYSSSQASGNRDLGPAPIKFTSATVGGGHVIIPGQSSVVIYGLIP